MTKKDVIDFLNEMIPNPRCELSYFNDYSLLISIMLSAQTTDKKVNIIAGKLFDRYPSLNDLANASLSDLKEIINPLGLANVKSKNIKKLSEILIKKYNGKVPLNVDELEKLPGIGTKTSRVFLVEYCNYQYLPVDTHVHRVSCRLGLANKTDTPLKVEDNLEKYFKGENLAKTHQRMVLFGRYICKANNPKCEICKFNKKCVYTKNVSE